LRNNIVHNTVLLPCDLSPVIKLRHDDIFVVFYKAFSKSRSMIGVLNL
jgi:hypothetical protein